MSDIPEAAIEAGAAALRRSWDDATEYGSAEEMAACALEAAAPHLRAAWEQPIRELCEAQIERANGPLSSRGFNGQPFPAMVPAVAILNLFEATYEEVKTP